MSRRRKPPAVVKMPCRRRCGRTVTTLSRPIHSTQADYDRYHGICSECLTEEEHKDMQGAMLLRTAQNIVKGLRGE